MTKVPLVLFNSDGSVFHCYEAEVVSETADAIVVKVPDHDKDYLETYSKSDGQCLDGHYPLFPQYVMITAQKPLKNSFAHLPEMCW